MSLFDYKQFLKESIINESGLQAGEFDELKKYIADNGIKGNSIDYSDILKSPSNSGNSSAVLNELNRFEFFLSNLQSNATAISSMAENLVGVVFGGENSNDPSGKNTIFSDVNIPAGSPTLKVSVKSSKKTSAAGVLQNTPIKFNQILSVLFHNGESEVREAEYAQLIEDIKNDKKPPTLGGNYGAAVVYSDGVDAIIEKTNDLPAEDIWNNVRKNINTIGPAFVAKGEWDLGSISRMKTIGWSFDTKITILGKAPADIKAEAEARKIILKNIELKLSNDELKDIAKQYNLSMTA